MVTEERILLLARFCVGNSIYCCFKVLIAYIENVGTLVFVDHFWLHLQPPQLMQAAN
jgi:hypothetical protein